VLAVIYLIFYDGYGGRGDLAGDALRLGWMLAGLMPDEPEAHGLLALMLLHDARRHARFAGESLCSSPTKTAPNGTGRESRKDARLERAVALHGRGPYLL